MNKQQRLSAARDYALTIALHKVPTQAQEDALKEAGKLSRNPYGFRFDDASGDVWQIVPPRRGRQRAVAYKWSDWEKSQEADRLICAWQLEHAQGVVDSIEAAGLRNEAQEGIDRAHEERRRYAENPQRMVFELLEAGLPGVEFEWIGEWVWATGDTRPNKETLKAAGFKWSAKKTAWYWKPEGSKPKTRRARYGSVDSLRKHWQQRVA